MNIGRIFKKQGGFSLIKKYAYNHVLLSAFFSFLFISKNRVGLELFRENMNNKIFFRLQKKYKKVIKKNLSTDFHKIEKPKIIWFCWFQGIENAPVLVKKCFESIKKNLPDYKIHLLTANSVFDFVLLPDYIIQKWKRGIISKTHFSDIIRNNLLVLYGGTWIDATVFMTSPIPLDIENSDLFFFRTFKPGSDGKAVSLSSWFISSAPHNPVLEMSQNLLFEYWRKHSYLCDYFLFHNFVQIALNTYPICANAIPKYTNETPHFMLFELVKPFDSQKWDSITAQSFCHKLTYKLSDEEMAKDGTFYKKIVREE